MSATLSIVAPVFNEEQNLRDLCQRIHTAVSEKFPEYEIILVDDCSRDGSWLVIEQLVKEFPQVRGLQFSRNMGEHIAVSAGLEHADGKYVVIMDSDLQDPPEAIPDLYNTLEAGGFDLVYAIRRNRQHSWMKRQTSSLFWLLLRWMTALDIPRDQATLRIMTKRFRDALCALPERNRFVYGLSTVIGFRQKGVEVEHGKRVHGHSNYNVVRLLHLAGTAIISLSAFPLSLAFLVGLVITTVATLLALDVIIQRLFFHITMEGWASLMTAVLFMGGIQLMMTGLLGMYLGKNYIETKQRPLYFLAKDTRNGK